MIYQQMLSYNTNTSAVNLNNDLKKSETGQVSGK